MLLLQLLKHLAIWDPTVVIFVKRETKSGSQQQEVRNYIQENSISSQEC